MSGIKTRNLIIRRHPQLRGRLILCDEETGQPLEGQTSLVVDSGEDGMPKVTVTFDAWGAYGIRFEDEPRKNTNH